MMLLWPTIRSSRGSRQHRCSVSSRGLRTHPGPFFYRADRAGRGSVDREAFGPFGLVSPLEEAEGRTPSCSGTAEVISPTTASATEIGALAAGGSALSTAQRQRTLGAFPRFSSMTTVS